MAGINKSTMDMLINFGLIGGVAVGGWFAYNNNFFGIRDMIGGLSQIKGQTGMPLPAPPVQQTPMTIGQPFSPTGSVPNLSGFETGYSPGGGPIPGGAPGIDYTSAMYDSPFGTPSIDPRTGIDYSLYYPPTGVGTLPGSNPTPYPNPCLPGYYRASDLKCYPIPTQFPGNGCGTGMYLANDGRCYPYPNGPGGGLGPGGAGGGYAPTPCPLGEYRASDGRCYALPTPPPESCPTGAYRASDGKCYPINPNIPPGDCPAGYTKGSDGVCRASTACPAGYNMQNGVCVQQVTQCPTGYSLINGVCVQNPATGCPTGYILHNGMCIPTGPGPAPGPSCPPGYVLQGNVCVPIQSGPGSPSLNIHIGSRTLIKELPPGVSPGQFSESILKRDPYKVDVTMWMAVMRNPYLAGGGIPQYAVIINAVDASEMNDAITRVGFRPLTPGDLMTYMPASGGFMAQAMLATTPRSRRRFNNTSNYR